MNTEPIAAPRGDAPTMPIHVVIDVPTNWESRLDMQWIVEREIKANRWSWKLPDEVESLKQQLAFAASIHKVAVQQRDTAWAALNDRNDRVDYLTRALNTARYEIDIWSRRYQDFAAEMANVVALRAPAPVLISLPPDSGDWAEALSRAINPKEPK